MTSRFRRISRFVRQAIRFTGLAEVSGFKGSTSSDVQTRPLLSVYAVRRSTGEQLLLVYEDLAQRKQPSQIIRLVPASDSAGRKGGERK